MSIEAMKRWLAALERAELDGVTGEALSLVCPAITEISQAIEQAQKQEPVAWLSKGGKGIWFHEPDASLNATPLYTSPPQRQWVGLTDEERKACMRLSEYHIEEVARAVEDTLKRKNK